MDQILLNANLKTVPCTEALHLQNDESLVPVRLERIYDLVGARKEDQFVFTSSGAEAVNQVLWSVFLNISRKTGKCHLITSTIEDAATMQMMKRLEELGCFVKIAPVNQKGEIDLEQLKALINPRTALISITMAQGLTGVIQPIDEIQKIAREKGVLLHLEASNAIGKFYFDFDVDYLTFSGDRIHAPIGTGALFAKKEAPLVPLILGGNSLRGGALDTQALLSFSAACAQSALHLDAMSLEVARLRDFFEREICQKIADAKVLFKTSLRLPNTSVIAFPFVHQEALHYFLRRKNIETLIGGNTIQHLYPLLLASNIEPTLATCSLSFSMSRTTTQEEICRAVTQIAELTQKIRSHAMFPAQTLTYNLNLNKKIREKIERPRFIGKLSEKEGMRLVQAEEKGLTLYWHVDEMDGVIADARYEVFGPITLYAIGEIVSELVIRKNIVQASRINADLVDGPYQFPKEASPLINQAILAIDSATQQCSDIECVTHNYDVTPIEWENSENPNGIPGWEEFAIDKKLHLIEEVIDKEIRPYVELDEGGVKVVELKENDLTISYQGSCTTCHSATGSTLTAIQQILRAKVHPRLSVIPQL
jgi:cysteine desulfurase